MKFKVNWKDGINDLKCYYLFLVTGEKIGEYGNLTCSSLVVSGKVSISSLYNNIDLKNTQG